MYKSEMIFFRDVLNRGVFNTIKSLRCMIRRLAFSAFFDVKNEFLAHCSLILYAISESQSLSTDTEGLFVSYLLCEKYAYIRALISNIIIYYNNCHTKYVCNIHMLVSKERERKRNTLYLSFFVPPVLLEKCIYPLAKRAFILTKAIKTVLLEQRFPTYTLRFQQNLAI